MTDVPESAIGVSASSKLAALFEKHALDAKRLAYLMTGDMALAEDISQEAFIRVAGRLGHLRDPDRFPGYLRKTIVNLVRMHMRRSKIASDAAPMLISSANDPLATHDLRDALRKLPYLQRAAIVFRFFLDLDDVESAELLRCSRSNVRSLIFRALTTLRSEVEP